MKILSTMILLLFIFSGCVIKNDINSNVKADKNWDELFDSKEWLPINPNQVQDINNTKG